MKDYSLLLIYGGFGEKVWGKQKIGLKCFYCRGYWGDFISVFPEVNMVVAHKTAFCKEAKKEWNFYGYLYGYFEVY